MGEASRPSELDADEASNDEGKGPFPSFSAGKTRERFLLGLGAVLPLAPLPLPLSWARPIPMT